MLYLHPGILSNPLKHTSTQSIYKTKGKMSVKKHQNLLSKVESILQVNLYEDLDLPKIDVQKKINELLEAIEDYNNQLEKFLDPQWIVLAAGQGTRIDASSILNKNLDIWFGTQNTLQLSRSYLPGSRPHITVINPDMKRRLKDSETKDRLLGDNAIVVVQPEPDGPGGALRAACSALEETDAEFVGVAYGDEPFLSKDIYIQTFMEHFVKKADVTLCGKIPETVVDKGGLFFDSNGKFMKTKEWKEMTEEEKQEMWDRLARREAYTNTGITLIRRDALLERIDKLEPHGEKAEFHHVDLIRFCYEDGLRTNAFIYRKPIISGVNRWTNVLEGERVLFERQRLRFAKLGVRVDPNARISVDASDDFEIGRASYLLGSVHIGKNVKIGNYCRLENVVLENTEVGDQVGLKDVYAKNSVFKSNEVSQPVACPIDGLNVCTVVESCKFDEVEVGKNTSLKNVEASCTVIPDGVCLSDETIS